MSCCLLQAPLPNLDERIYECELVPSEHEWLHFIDTIQYVGDEKDVTIRKNDIVVGTQGSRYEITYEMKKMKEYHETKMKEMCKISFLKRPYGRPNRTPADERGWLYAERITVAIRMAAAKEEMFDDVVMSNETILYIRILWLVEETSFCQRLGQETGQRRAIGELCWTLSKLCCTMKFTVPSDTTLVRSDHARCCEQIQDELEGGDETTERYVKTCERDFVEMGLFLGGLRGESGVVV